MPDDPVLSYTEAAKHAGGCTRQAIYLILSRSGIEPELTEARVGFGKRVVKGVRRSVIDAFVAQGYLKARPRQKSA